MKFYDREPFDDQRVEAIRIQLENLAATGNPSDYQVFLDDMEIVPRTNDPQRFTSFYDLIGPKSENLIINLFSGSTRHKRSYNFYFNGNKQQGELNGVDVQKTIDNEVARHALQFENKLFSEQIKDLRQEIVGLEEENEQLKEDNQSLREDLKKATGENGIANTVMGGVERLFDRYLTPAQQKGLSGPGQQQQQTAAPAGTINVPLHEYDNFRQFAVLAEKFDPNTEFGKVLSIVKYLSDNKPAIDETLSFLYEESPDNQ